MPFDEIVSIAEKIETTTKLTTPQYTVQEQKIFRQWSQGKNREKSKAADQL